jgi:hypothetical protein
MPIVATVPAIAEPKVWVPLVDSVMVAVSLAIVTRVLTEGAYRPSLVVVGELESRLGVLLSPLVVKGDHPARAVVSLLYGKPCLPEISDRMGVGLVRDDASILALGATFWAVQPTRHRLVLLTGTLATAVEAREPPLVLAGGLLPIFKLLV